jgi:hypothetical protein
MLWPAAPVVWSRATWSPAAWQRAVPPGDGDGSGGDVSLCEGEGEGLGLASGAGVLDRWLLVCEEQPPTVAARRSAAPSQVWRDTPPRR